jgi:hypothetical protein
MEVSLADVLTLAGAAIAAPLVTGLVEVLKRSAPKFVSGNEQAMALAASMVLVIAASVDRHQTAGVTTLNDVFVSFVAWLAIAKLATAVHDEVTAAPGSFREASA